MNRRNAIKNTGFLAGGSIALPSLAVLLNACQSTDRLDWAPEFLSQDEAMFVAAFVDFILPKTDTPGALDAKVDVFIDKVVAELYDDDGQAKIRSEIADFNKQCVDAYGNNFAKMTSEEKAELISNIEASSPTFNGGVWGTAVGEQKPVGFVRSMKSMACWAYFSSEEVGKNVLRYDPVPQGYDGCLDFGEGDRKWSL